jgi:hypothetical protein
MVIAAGLPSGDWCAVACHAGHFDSGADRRREETNRTPADTEEEDADGD